MQLFCKKSWMHVDRSKGKAPLIPNVGISCNILKEHIKRPATSMLSRLRDFAKIDLEHIVSVSSFSVECKLTMVK